MPNPAITTAQPRVTRDALAQLFRPRSVALIGASDRSRWSAVVFANLTRYSQGLAVHVVNPNQREVHGQAAFAQVADIPDVPDLAFVATSADRALTAIAEAADAGVRNVVVLSGGFDESGPTRSRRLAELREHHDLTVLGPNASGFINVAERIAPYGLMIPDPTYAGSVTLVQQSGGLLGACLHGAAARGLGLNLVCALGGESFVGAEDVIDYAAADPGTRAIAVFLEAIRRPHQFRNAARAALEAGKPIVLLKAGRSVAGARAALSHTGALAGDAEIIDAVLDDLDVIRVEDLDELLTVATLLESGRGSAGRRVAVVSASGGQNNIAADAAERNGLSIPPFGDALAERIAGLLPDEATAENPLDVTGVAVSDPTLLPAVISELGRAGKAEFDWIAHGAFFPALLAGSDAQRDTVLDTVARSHQDSQLPVVLHSAVSIGLPPAHAVALRERGLTALSSTDLALRAIAKASDYFGVREQMLAEPRPVTAEHGATPRAAQSSPQVTLRPGARALSEWEAREALSAIGVPFPKAALARTALEAVAIADELGADLVLKICSPWVTHKSDMGGVLIGVAPNQVAQAFDRLLSLAHELPADQPLDGVIVAERVGSGVELLVGTVHDPAWGHFLLLGLGGVLVDVLGDVVRVALPTSPARIDRALRRLRGFALLTGARGAPGVDLHAVVSAIEAVASFSVGAGSHIDSVEINPLLARPDGVFALDALITGQGAPR